MEYKKKTLFPLRRIGNTEFNYEREVYALASALISTTDVESDLTLLIAELADGEEGMVDWYTIIEGERIPFQELDDRGEYNEDDHGVIYVLDDHDLIAVLERYILRKKDMKSFEHVVKLFNVQRYVAVEVMYRTLHNYLLIERIDTARQIIDTFFDGI